MKKVLFAFAVLIVLAACTNKQGTAPASEGNVENIEVADEVETTYFSAIDRYLADSIGSNYAQGEYCIPIHTIVGVDERNAEDILVWGVGRLCQEAWPHSYSVSRLWLAS